MKRLLAEENKEIPNENPMLHLRADVRENIKAVNDLSRGVAVISQPDTKILELQEKLAERERIQHWRKHLIGSISYQV